MDKPMSEDITIKELVRDERSYQFHSTDGTVKAITLLNFEALPSTGTWVPGVNMRTHKGAQIRFAGYAGGFRVSRLEADGSMQTVLRSGHDANSNKQVTRYEGASNAIQRDKEQFRAYREYCDMLADAAAHFLDTDAGQDFQASLVEMPAPPEDPKARNKAERSGVQRALAVNGNFHAIRRAMNNAKTLETLGIEPQGSPSAEFFKLIAERKKEEREARKAANAGGNIDLTELVGF